MNTKCFQNSSTPGLSHKFQNYNILCEEAGLFVAFNIPSTVGDTMKGGYVIRVVS